MARKVFLSVLGTNSYSEVTYKKGDFEKHTRFIQEATLEYHKTLGVEMDDIYILLTAGAKSKNWETNGNNKGLGDVLSNISNMGPKPRVHDVTIKEGKDEAELWDIFNTMFELMNDEDELYLDSTHGFRYLPMLVLVFANYAKSLKNVKVKAITYGNWEVSDRGNKPAPIMDLLPLAQLQDWTFAAANFIENGDVENLKNLVNEELRPLLFDQETRTDDVRKLRNYINHVTELVTQMRFCRGIKIYNSDAYERIQNNLPQNNTTFIQPLNPLLDKINKSVEKFSSEPSAQNQLAAARWCFDRKQYQTAVTFLQEGIITFFCDKHGINRTMSKKREIVNHAFTKCYLQIHPNGQYKPMTEKEDEEKVDEIVATGELSEWVMNFTAISDIRNDFNHAGMNGGPMPPDYIKTNIDNQIKFATDKLCSSANTDTASLPLCFVNLSNHPSAYWSKEQKKAALSFGEIEDMEFPDVAPDASEEDIAEKAGRITQAICKKAETQHVTVHVMGEMTLVFAIVSRLQAVGIECVASTTQRKAEVRADGSKYSEFKFQRFRKYGE